MATLEPPTRTEPDRPPTARPSAALDPSLEFKLQRVMDLGERVLCLLLFAPFCLRLAHSLAIRPWDGLVLLSEGLVVVFVVFRRRPQMVSTRPVDWLFAMVGTAGPMLVTAGGRPFAPPSLGAALMVSGLLISIWAKLTLRRSFGLTAANRGVVHAGPYSFVRHPMYAGYILVDCGFLLVNPLAWNAGVYLITIVTLVARVLAEEKVLARDPAYAAFMERTRYRLAPGLF